MLIEKETAQKSSTLDSEPVKYRTLITMKSGHSLVCDYSVGYLKHKRRTGGVILLKSPRGERVMVDCAKIRSVSPQTA